MVWAQIAMAAVNVVTGMQTASAKKKLGEAQYKYEKGRADNKFLQQAAQNSLNAANADVERANQQRQNKQAMRQLERGLEAESFNYGKAVDGLNSNRFDQRIAGASALGTLAASAGAAGVGGASIQQLEQTEQLRQERADLAMKDQIKDATYATAMNRTSIMDNQYNALDDTLILPGFDYSARDFVMDNRSQNKYGLHNIVSDGMNGFSGNMNQVGVNVQDFGYTGQSMFGSGTKNKGLGGGAPITAAKGTKTRL